MSRLIVVALYLCQKDVDYVKLSECFWWGFDHDEIPPAENIDGNIKRWNAPHADLKLMIIAVSPNSEYACALGMWFDPQNKYAYLEPLATVPKYRRLGLATICLTEAMKSKKPGGDLLLWRWQRILHMYRV